MPPMAATAENREIVAMLPLSKYLNGCPVRCPASRCLICPATCLPPCIATWATPGRLSSAIMSPTTNTSGCPGRLRSGLTLTRPARSTSASLCSASCWPSGEALTPAAHTLQRDRIRRSVPSGSITSTPVLSTPTTLTLSWTSTPILASWSRAAGGQLLAERPEHRRRGVQQDHPGLAGVDPAEVPAQRPVRQLGDLARHLHPGGAGADDDEGQPLLGLGRVGAQLGQLERPEDPAAQLQRVVDALHPGRELGELVVAEVGLAGPGGHDQAVVRGHRGAQRAERGHGARGRGRSR